MTFTSTLGPNGWEVEAIDLPPARIDYSSGSPVLMGPDGAIPINQKGYLGDVIVVGDSISCRAYNGHHLAGGRPVRYGSTGVSTLGATFVVTYTPDYACTSGGTGVLRFVKSTSKMYWTAPSDAEGSGVDVSSGGCFYIPSATDELGIVVSILAANAPAADAQDNITVGTTFGYRHDMRDWSTQLRWKIGGAAYNNWYSYGISGSKFSHVISGLPTALAMSPNTAIVNCGTNDAAGGRTLAQMQEDAQALWAALHDGGVAKIIQPTITPTTNGSYTAGVLGVLYQFNRWLIEQGSASDFLFVVDVNPHLSDPAVLTGAARSGMLDTDALHPTELGAHVISRAILDEGVARGFLAVMPLRVSNAIDTYHATNNPYGNMNKAGTGMFYGTGGTLSAGSGGAVPIGTLAQYWRALSSASSTIATTLSKENRTDLVGGVWQRVVFSGTPTNYDTVTVYNYSSSGYPGSAADGVNTTSTYRMTADVRFSGVTGISVSIGIMDTKTDFTNSPAGKYFETWDGDTEVFYNFKSDPIKLPAAITQVKCQAFVTSRATNGAGTIDLANFDFRPVVIS